MRIPSRHVRATRVGWTLVEISFMIALLGIVSAVGTTMLITLLQLDSSLTTGTATEMTAQLLEDRLLSDTRLAHSIDLADDQLVLTMPDETHVTYQILRDEIRRTTQQDSLNYQDRFVFDSSDIVLEVQGRLLVLNVRQQAAAQESEAVSAQEFEMVFHVGFGNRFSDSQTVVGEET